MAKELTCPNCGPDHKLIEKTDGDLVCGFCNGTFHPGIEPKVVAIGEFDEVKQRLAKVEADNLELRELVSAGKPIPDDEDAKDEPIVTPEETEQDL